jgi:hypothetical protein
MSAKRSNALARWRTRAAVLLGALFDFVRNHPQLRTNTLSLMRSDNGPLRAPSALGFTPSRRR